MTFQGLVPFVYEEYEWEGFRDIVGGGRDDLVDGDRRLGRGVERGR